MSIHGGRHAQGRRSGRTSTRRYSASSWWLITTQKAARDSLFSSSLNTSKVKLPHFLPPPNTASQGVTNSHKAYQPFNDPMLHPARARARERKCVRVSPCGPQRAASATSYMAGWWWLCNLGALLGIPLHYSRARAHAHTRMHRTGPICVAMCEGSRAAVRSRPPALLRQQRGGCRLLHIISGPNTQMLL